MLIETKDWCGRRVWINAQHIDCIKKVIHRFPKSLRVDNTEWLEATAYEVWMGGAKVFDLDELEVARFL